MKKKLIIVNRTSLIYESGENAHRISWRAPATARAFDPRHVGTHGVLLHAMGVAETLGFSLQWPLQKQEVIVPEGICLAVNRKKFWARE